ncbi:MAG: hypothetical protein F8N15_00920 [Methanobacterium sp.]|nr:hypothetical protein [Methanobacterium sp.]
MTWFQRNESPDREFLVRRERLKSEISQARLISLDSALDLLEQYLDGLTSVRPTPADLLTLQKVEAELCLFKPTELLYPTLLRFKSRLYRCDPDMRTAWEADLKRLMPGESQISDERALRQRLRHLTYELNEAAEAFNRTSVEKSRVVRSLTAVGCLLIVLLIAIIEVIASNDGWPPGPVLLSHWLIPGTLAGALGATTTATTAISNETARREEYLYTLMMQLLLRTALGAVYALVVLAAASSKFIPIMTPSSETSVMFALVLGFVAGFSDKLFGQTVSQLIIKSSGSSPRSERDTTRKGRGSL